MRYPAKLGQAGAVIPPDYPAVSPSGKLMADQVDCAARTVWIGTGVPVTAPAKPLD
ncbi:hypothetical protein ACFQX4_20565 [Roseomonas sp. GCM10028921]